MATNISSRRLLSGGDRRDVTDFMDWFYDDFQSNTVQELCDTQQAGIHGDLKANVDVGARQHTCSPVMFTVTPMPMNSRLHARTALLSLTLSLYHWAQRYVSLSVVVV